MGARNRVSIFITELTGTQATCNKSFMAAGSKSHAVGDRLAQIASDTTPAEQKVARALTTSAMLAGFETVAALAKRAGVSGPTVVRFVTRLGYASYADFQRALLNEMEARGTSPLDALSSSRYQARRSARAIGERLHVRAACRDLPAIVDRRFRICRVGACRAAQSCFHHRRTIFAAPCRDAVSASLPDPPQCLDAGAGPADARRSASRCRTEERARRL